MKYSEIVNQISEELNLPPKVVDRTYKAYWYFIKSTIEALPLKENINEEEFSKLRTNFNIPSLGKLIATYEKVLGQKSRYNFIKTLRDAEDKKD